MSELEFPVEKKHAALLYQDGEQVILGLAEGTLLFVKLDQKVRHVPDTWISAALYVPKSFPVDDCREPPSFIEPETETVRPMMLGFRVCGVERLVRIGHSAQLNQWVLWEPVS